MRVGSGGALPSPAMLYRMNKAYEVRTSTGHTLTRTLSWEDACEDLLMYVATGDDIELVTVYLTPGQGWSA